MADLETPGLIDPFDPFPLPDCKPSLAPCLEETIMAFGQIIRRGIKIFQNRCDADPWVLVMEAPRSLFLNPVLMVVGTSTGDVTRGFLRRATRGGGSRGARHTRRFTTKGRSLKRDFLRRLKPRVPIPETGALIGGKLADGVGAGYSFRQVEHPIERWVWLKDDVIQRGLWNFLILDVIDSTTYRWATALLTTEACRDAGDPYGVIYTTQNSYAAISNWNGLSASTTCIKAGPVGGPMMCPLGLKSIGLNVPAGYTGFYMFAVEGKNEDTVTREWKIRAVNEFDVQKVGSSFTADPGSTYKIMVAGTIDGPNQIVPEVWLSEGFDSSEGKVVGFGQAWPKAGA